MHKTVDKWIFSSSDSPIPPFAVLGGQDLDGSPIYVGRAFHEGINLPAKVVPSKNCAYVSWGGREIQKTDYEVLVGEEYVFIKPVINTIPINAVRVGSTVEGDPLYIGRGIWEGNETVGKIHPPNRCLFIPFNGEEETLETFEVLIREEKHVWVPGTLDHVPPFAVIGGEEQNHIIYVGRAHHEGETLPAKIIPATGSVYVSRGGHDVYKSEFEYLVGMGYTWVYGIVEGFDIPPGAVWTGHTQDGEKVYVGRGHYHGSLTPGKVHPGYPKLFIPYGGKEVKMKDFEVLTRR
ncbi:uncharacterized protein LOC129905913 [Episyrphus balteatus]|uniref:uncharacterized protein LOC129905913 n=1 Tax=Episyrphus balteatus TaxID=286459 RepID=UPI00248544B9|nr:uncharacterized protein LOC129905913 [Episyrphus balteatus]